jgi:hypothetical protein
VTSRGAHFQAFLSFTRIRAAHDEELWNEYTKPPRCVRQRTKMHQGKPCAFNNFNEFSALKEDKSQKLVVAYGAGRPQKRAHQRRRHEHTRNARTVFPQCR